MKQECQTKCKLLKAAMILIAETSYDAVSVEDICQSAGVKKGSFYYFFASKSDLIVATMEAEWQEKQPEYDRIFSPQIPPLARFTNYCDSVLSYHSTQRFMRGKVLTSPMISLGVELRNREEKVRLKSAEIIARYIKYFETAIRDAAIEGMILADQPQALAYDLFAYFQGCMLSSRICDNGAALGRMKMGMMRLLNCPEGADAA